MPDNPPTQPDEPSIRALGPIAIRDGSLLPFLTAVRMREIRQARAGKTDHVRLLYPLPDCPLCEGVVRDLQLNIRDFLRSSSSVVDIRLQPCGHWFTTTEGTIDRLAPYAIDAATNLDNHIPEPRRATPEQITDALGIDRLTNWPDVLAAARRLGQEHQHQREVIASVRRLHHPVVHGDRFICGDCSAYDGTGSTDNAPVGYADCETIRRLDERPDTTCPQRPADEPDPGTSERTKNGPAIATEQISVQVREGKAGDPPPPPAGTVFHLPPGYQPDLSTSSPQWGPVRWVSDVPTEAPTCPAGLLSRDAIRRCVIKGPHVDHQAEDGTRWTNLDDLDVTDAPFLTRRPTTPGSGEPEGD